MGKFVSLPSRWTDKNLFVLIQSESDPNTGEQFNQQVMGVFESYEKARGYPFVHNGTKVNWYSETNGISHDGFVAWHILRSTLHV